MRDYTYYGFYKNSLASKVARIILNEGITNRKTLADKLDMPNFEIRAFCRRGLERGWFTETKSDIYLTDLGRVKINNYLEKYQ